MQKVVLYSDTCDELRLEDYGDLQTESRIVQGTRLVVDDGARERVLAVGADVVDIYEKLGAALRERGLIEAEPEPQIATARIVGETRRLSPEERAEIEASQREYRRDQLARDAMVVILQQTLPALAREGRRYPYEVIAAHAYALADAMLAARDKKGEG